MSTGSASGLRGYGRGSGRRAERGEDPGQGEERPGGPGREGGAGRRGGPGRVAGGPVQRSGHPGEGALHLLRPKSTEVGGGRNDERESNPVVV